MSTPPGQTVSVDEFRSHDPTARHVERLDAGGCPPEWLTLRLDHDSGLGAVRGGSPLTRHATITQPLLIELLDTERHAACRVLCFCSAEALALERFGDREEIAIRPRVALLMQDRKYRVVRQDAPPNCDVDQRSTARRWASTAVSHISTTASRSRAASRPSPKMPPAPRRSRRRTRGSMTLRSDRGDRRSFSYLVISREVEHRAHRSMG